MTLAIMTLCTAVFGQPAVDCIPPQPPPIAGILSQYDLGVMPPVVEARQAWDQLPDDLSGIDGFVAAWDCDRIGDRALLSIDGSEWITVIVADCSGHQSTTDWMIANDVLFEISGELAQEYGVVCRCAVPGEVIWLQPIDSYLIED